MKLRGCGISPKEVALIPNPIHKVLFIFRNFRVRALLMGGQACVFYGGAEFSRDIDFAIHADPDNLEPLRPRSATSRLQVLAVPPFSLEYLNVGMRCIFAAAPRGPECA